MLLSLLLAVACDTASSSSEDATCALDVPTLAPASAAPGAQVVVTAHPLTDVWDTAVTVGPTRADLVDLDRSTCDTCDDCRDTGECSSCDVCDVCATDCEGCVETVTFVVPDLAPGEWPVEVVNRHGRTQTVTLTVLAAETP
jgi:hypothetical protein